MRYHFKNIGLFIISSVVVLMMVVEKYFFYNLEPIYSRSIIGNVELAIVSISLVLGILAFFIRSNERPLVVSNVSKSSKLNLISMFLVALSILSAVMSFTLNLNKKSIHWDAIALYDARARFISGGMIFSKMPSLSTYDNLNKYYYLLYPPYTSIAHYFWNSNSYTSMFPIGTYYSILFSLFLVLIYLVLKEYDGQLVASVVLFLASTNSSLFNVVIKEYTNLPFNLHLVVGVFLLYSYFKCKSLWKLIFGILLVSTSIWIRLLEPIWLVILVSFIIVLFLSKDTLIKKIYISLLLIIVCAVEYLAWIYFTKSVSSNPGFINFSINTMVDPLFALFTGAPFVVFFTILKSWGIPLVIHLGTLFSMLLQWKEVMKDKSMLFLALVIFFSIGLYFSEFYMLSFQADWWSIVTQSLDRSGSFLIPISAFVLISQITNNSLLKK